MAVPRVLFSSAYFPANRYNGASVRAHSLLRAYAKFSRVTLCTAYLPSYVRVEDEIPALKDLCEDMYLVPVAELFKTPPRPTLRTLTQRKPFLASMEIAEPVKARFHELLRGVDLVHVGRLASFVLLDDVAGRDDHIPIVLDLDENEHQAAQRRHSIQRSRMGFVRRAVMRYDLRRLKHHQHRVIEACDRVFVSSALERTSLPGYPHVAVVSNGANIPATTFPESAAPRLLFVGSLSYMPNIDGLLWFVRESWPLVLQALPAATLTIVGSAPLPRVSELHDGERIFVHADVESVDEYYLQTSVSIVPLRAGGGTRLKILDSFAFGRPVVSTTIGSEGLSVQDGRELLVRDEPAAFARACAELISNGTLRRQLVASARTLVEREYSWTRVGETMRELVEPCLAENYVPRRRRR